MNFYYHVIIFVLVSLQRLYSYSLYTHPLDKLQAKHSKPLKAIYKWRKSVNTYKNTDCYYFSVESLEK